MERCELTMLDERSNASVAGEPPNAGVDIQPSMLEVSHPLDVLVAVFDWIEERIQRLFEG